MTPLLITLVIALLSAPDNEQARLERHFATVERELHARDVSALSAQQRAARARNIRVLREYARAGVFPHNHDFDDARTPYFRDAHGTLCAMAYLIARSGDTGLVDRVARTNNNAFIRDLAADPELIAWLERNGLSVAEAARIQPTYGPAPGEPVEHDDDYEAWSATTAIVQGGAITWTLVANPKRSGALPGVAATVTGVFSMLLGAAGTIEPEESLAKFNVVTGAATTAAGIVYLYRRYYSPAPKARTGSVPVRWEPVVGNADDGSTRVGVSYRF